MTIDDLNRILVACAGEADSGPLTEQRVDTTFEDLGYDSLARMETASRIADEFGLSIPDDQVMELRTPRDVLDLVNSLVRA
ncbi:actinorhodin polyketide synthase [Modestobacter sp. I12A-02628]|uniref:Acyl carrier protein n=1 Tax=Goekera deserti TaxID=2497753 RepID=A0A7K3WDV3_9ACTN|nr:acyl carrier protein [Goekera deserti]MPQ97200.1 actinorhodin polyketide synthase [Goekera deserti]NDI46482.1 actinorhodin polyketide synthase [Goekera deserti]NEL54584.1 acyl carrier protein [Goekera deserti]